MPDRLGQPGQSCTVPGWLGEGPKQPGTKFSREWLMALLTAAGYPVTSKHHVSPVAIVTVTVTGSAS